MDRLTEFEEDIMSQLEKEMEIEVGANEEIEVDPLEVDPVEADPVEAPDSEPEALPEANSDESIDVVGGPGYSLSPIHLPEGAPPTPSSSDDEQWVDILRQRVQKIRDYRSRMKFKRNAVNVNFKYFIDRDEDD